MPTSPRLTRRRLLLTGFLLAAALVAALILTAPGPLDAARAKYDRIQVGMADSEVRAILEGWESWGYVVGGPCIRYRYYDPHAGVRIWVVCDWGGKVTDKEFEEGDQSYWTKVERLKSRLTDKLHLGP
jgi:hypothetical protein